VIFFYFLQFDWLQQRAVFYDIIGSPTAMLLNAGKKYFNLKKGVAIAITLHIHALIACNREVSHCILIHINNYTNGWQIYYQSIK
jgi:hypothetical protein